jgi:peptidoglycan/LPS O-acetylase OafA/YrhL
VMAMHFVGFTAGWVGVDLFFVLSGFLITWKLVQAIDAPNYYLAFYWRRIVRVVPLYMVILVFIFFIFPLLVPSLITSSYHHLLNTQMWHWTFTQNFYIARNGWPANISINHLWSLAAEVQFYLLWPFVIRFFYKRPRRFTSVIIGFIAFAILFRLFAGQFIPLSPLYRYVLLPGRIDAFAAGTLLFILMQRYGSGLKQIMFWIAMAGTAANVVLYGVLRMPINHTADFVSRFGYTFIDISLAAWLGYALLAAKNNIIQQVFTKKILTSTGRYSYAMYIVHLPLWTMLNRLLENKYGLQLKHEPLLLWTVSLALTGIVYLIGYISYHTFERYFMRLKAPALGGDLTHLEPRRR